MIFNYWGTIAPIAEAFKFDVNLIAAICMTESGGNPWAMRYEPNYRWVMGTNQTKGIAEKLGITVETLNIAQKTSWGLMQIMGAICYDEYGYMDHPARLCDPYTGVLYGCTHLAKLREKWAHEPDLISAYNQGSPHKTTGGLYSNQRYVDKVHSFLVQLRS